MVKHLIIVVALLLAPIAGLEASELYVSTKGSDRAIGNSFAPFLTIQRAYDKARPGDIIVLRKGTYREAISLTNKSGKEGAPITLKAYKDENPIISGLDVLKLDWQATPQAGVYVASFDTPTVRQLFYNGKPMLEARWPHCPKDKNGEWDFFSPDMWATADAKGNSYGTLVCADLAITGWDVTGAQALLNVDHQFYCWTRPVRTHMAGSNTITYDQNLGPDVDQGNEFGIRAKWHLKNKLYLFGKRKFLGMPGEWFYDGAAKNLYVCSPDGESPANSLLEIKTREWGLTADNACNYLTIDGIGFFGTAFKLGKDDNHKSSHIIFRNSTVLYSSWTEYCRLPQGDTSANAKADQIYPTIDADDSQVVNNTFAFGALSALSINGFDNLIENNLFHDFNLNSSLNYPPLSVGRSWVAGKSGRARVIQNTLSRSGGIQAQLARECNDFSMNDVCDSFMACYGGNIDHSAVYTSSPNCTGTRIHHNWVHRGYAGTPPAAWGAGIGIRGDDDTCGLTVDHNVIWEIGGPGIHIKNVKNPTPEQANYCINNTVFAHSSYLRQKAAIYMESTWFMINSQSTCVNNLSDSILGWWKAKPLGPIKVFSNNSVAFNPTKDLVNAAWDDFRPASGATAIIDSGCAVTDITGKVVGKTPDIGAYERGDSIYWIPGRRLAKASHPIVPDQAQNVPADRDVLLWKPAYRAVAHALYFSTSKEAVQRASIKVRQATLQGEQNVFSLPKLSSGQAYYWRVDALMPDQSVIAGDVWTFSTPQDRIQ